MKSLILLAFVLVLIPLAFAHGGNDDIPEDQHEGMMDSGGMMGGFFGSSYNLGFMWVFGWLFWILIIVALILLIFWLVEQLQNKKKRK